MYIVKVSSSNSAGRTINKYYFSIPSDALRFALNVHAEMSEKYQSGLLEFCAVALICPEIGDPGWED